ncbi:MAG TPA: hypothetical protein VEY10_09150 [Flavisolibacter sp.]|jgi:hypothetical protein|nr:hypothetical protein [Flavisolibacter sp.]
MYKALRYTFFVFLLLTGVAVLAQSDKVPVYDSLMVSQEKNLHDPAFSPIRQAPVIEEKKVPQKKLDSLKKDDAYWYANIERLKKKEEIEQPGKSLFNAGWFTNLLWILIVISFIAIVIWYLASSNFQLFRKTPEKIFAEDESGITEDIFVLEYEREISKALDTANYRLAVRLWYLRTLKELSQRNLIIYSHEKTNSDYLYGLRGGRYYQGFFKLTRSFEYTWYGGFPVSQQDYAVMQQDFTSFRNSLPS